MLSNSRRSRFGVETKLPDSQLNGRQIFPLAGHFGSCLYRKQLLDQYDIWFDEGISMNEDQVFKIKALYMAKKIELSSRFCYVYCNNPKSIMHTLDRKIDRVNAWRCGYTWFERHLQGRERDVVLSYVQVKIQSRLLLYAQNYIQSGHSDEELTEELRRQNALELLENLTPAGVMQYQQHDLQLFQTDRKAFIQKAKREGIKISLGRLALKIHIVRWARDKKKYPLTKIPEP